MGSDPDFPEEIYAESEAEKQEQFDRLRWFPEWKIVSTNHKSEVELEQVCV